jgi:hypothetical protein
VSGGLMVIALTIKLRRDLRNNQAAAAKEPKKPIAD